MPAMNGLETLQRIAKGASRIGRVLITGNAADRQLSETGTIPLVRKPIDLKELAHACSQSMDMKDQVES